LVGRSQSPLSEAKGMGGKVSRASILVGLIAVAIVSVVVVRSLSQVDWDPTLYTAFGAEATSTTEYAQELLGDVFLRPAQGHDGKFFFVQANDPLILDTANAAVLDRPLYRSQRMLYPLLSGAFGLFGPGAIVWAMIAVNVIAFGIGSVATSDVAVSMGKSPWWGLAFGLNVGLYGELVIDGAGILSAALAFAALAAYLRSKLWPGVALMCLAVLSREAMLIAAVGSAYWLWRVKGERQGALMAGLGPFAAVGVWALYLRLRLGWEAGVSEVEEIGLPFVGFGRAFQGWIREPSLDLVLGLTIMMLMFFFARRALKSSHLLGLAFVGFVALGVLFTEQVWKSYFDISRAVAPLLTAYPILLFMEERAEPRKLAGIELDDG